MRSVEFPEGNPIQRGELEHFQEVSLMSARKLLFLLVLIAPVIQSCASTYAERITSDPPGADIYWGHSQSNFVDTDYVTPFERTIYGRSWEARCYQVRKEGYYDSEVICKPSEPGDRHIYFGLRLKPVDRVEISETGTETADTAKQEDSLLAEDSSIFLSAAKREQIPNQHGSAAKYLERYLKESGHWCYVEILPSQKHEGKFVIWINRYSSAGEFDKDKFTEAAILATASLSENVKWISSELFFDYSAFFEMDERNVGWAVISVEDCIEARNLLQATNNVDKFAAYWKSKIQYIADTDPEPTL